MRSLSCMLIVDAPCETNSPEGIGTVGATIPTPTRRRNFRRFIHSPPFVDQSTIPCTVAKLELARSCSDPRPGGGATPLGGPGRTRIGAVNPHPPGIGEGGFEPPASRSSDGTLPDLSYSPNETGFPAPSKEEIIPCSDLACQARRRSSPEAKQPLHGLRCSPLANGTLSRDIQGTYGFSRDPLRSC